jgi:secreted trypsin-like serine protease
MSNTNKPTPNHVRNALLAFGFVGFMLAALAGGKQVLGAKPGDQCNQTDDLFTCKWGSVCIGRTCYKSCSNDGDCPSGWTCANTDVTVETQHTFTKDKRDDKERICFAPKTPSAKR